MRDDDEEEAAGPRKKQLWVSYFSFEPPSVNNTKSPVKARKCSLIRTMKCHDILLVVTFNTLLRNCFSFVISSVKQSSSAFPRGLSLLNLYLRGCFPPSDKNNSDDDINDDDDVCLIYKCSNV